MATYEMLWDCPFCGTKKLLGKTHRHCPQCGAPQDPTYRYFPPDDEKVAVEDHVYVGTDRLCPACGNPMSAAAPHCSNCGSPMEGAGEVTRRADQVGDAFAGETEADARREIDAPAAPAPAPKPGRSRRKLVLAGVLGCGGLLVLAAAVLGIAAVFWTEPVEVTVTQRTWERTIEIETFGAVHEDEWCDRMPSGAYDVTRSSEVRSHEKVPDGEECTTQRVDNGDGTFTEKQVCTTKYREEPVYDEKCSYTVDRWVVDHVERASGSEADGPAWPEVALEKEGSAPGAQREGRRAETYTVHYEGAGKKTFTCTYPQDEWASIDTGSTWTGKAGALTGDLRCDSLTR